MLSVLGFLIILGPLVIVHELGHYFFARIFGVKAEVFSVGFGPKLWSKKRGETEWCVSAFPLGGYVKLLGEDREAELSPEEQRRALHKQKAWKRFFIFFGGPLFNFLWAIVVFAAILVIGEPQVASVVGRVVADSPAAKMGFMSGDRILSVNGKPVHKFEEVMIAINESPRKPLQMEVIHPGSATPVQMNVTPDLRPGFSLYGESTHVGEIDGLVIAARGTQVGISNPNSVAGKAGFKTGDQIEKVSGTPVTSWEQIEAFYEGSAPGSSLRVSGKRKNGEAFEVTLEKSKVQGRLGPQLGLHSSELFIEKVVSGSPAEKAGIRPGDRLVSVGDKQVQSFFELKDSIQKQSEDAFRAGGDKNVKVTVKWERAGEMLTAQIAPSSTEGRDPTLQKVTQFTIGVLPMLVMAEPTMFTERVLNPFVLVYKATERMMAFSWRNLVSVGKMVTGDVSVKTLGGPILIGKIAGESLSRGLITFLNMMAVLSIGLGVLNVLPVPVLDGGHLLLLGLETVRGKPLTIRQMEIIQLAGLILILTLMGVVMFNDISRLGSS